MPALSFTKSVWPGVLGCATLLSFVQACGGDVTIGENRAGAAPAPSQSSAKPLPLPAERGPEGTMRDEQDDDVVDDCMERFEDFEEFRDAGAPNPCNDFEPEFMPEDPSGPMDGFDSEEYFGPPCEGPREDSDAGCWEE
jgi:hypothetical protein